MKKWLHLFKNRIFWAHLLLLALALGLAVFPFVGLLSGSAKREFFGMQGLAPHKGLPQLPRERISRADVALMQSWHLFGVAASAGSQATPDLSGLKETALQVRILGLMVSRGDLPSSAILVCLEKADRYQVGDSLPFGKDVLLEAVFSDRVVINNRGVHETLFLYDTDKQAQVHDWRRDDQKKQVATFMRSQLIATNLADLTKIIRMSEVRDESGGLYGMRLQSGPERKTFASFGLQDGDVLTVFDGVPVADEGKLGGLIEALRTASEAEFQIERGGKLVVLRIGFQE